MRPARLHSHQLYIHFFFISIHILLKNSFTKVSHYLLKFLLALLVYQEIDTD